MSDDLLTLTQWLSPAFPIGAYAYSHGLEAAIHSGQVTGAETLERWLSDVLRHGSGRTDAILLVHSMDGKIPLREVAAQAEALCATRERYAETMQQGAAFTRAVNALTGVERPAMAMPVAVGAASATLDLTPERVAALYLNAFVSNLVTAGVRFIPIGQTDGQQVLSHLHSEISAVAAMAVTAELSEIGSAVFGADLAAMAHEDMDVRLFKT